MPEDDREHGGNIGWTRLEVDGRALLLLRADKTDIESGSLTEAERTVAALAAAGYSNALIASRRGTSVRTVVNQLASIYRKLGMESRYQLVKHMHGSTPA